MIGVPTSRPVSASASSVSDRMSVSRDSSSSRPTRSRGAGLVEHGPDELRGAAHVHAVNDLLVEG